MNKTFSGEILLANSATLFDDKCVLIEIKCFCVISLQALTKLGTRKGSPPVKLSLKVFPVFCSVFNNLSMLILFTFCDPTAECPKQYSQLKLHLPVTFQCIQASYSALFGFVKFRIFSVIIFVQ